MLSSEQIGTLTRRSLRDREPESEADETSRERTQSGDSKAAPHGNGTASGPTATSGLTMARCRTVAGPSAKVRC